MGFFVPGFPVPQGSLRSFATKHGKIVTIHSNRNLGAWRSAIATQAARVWPQVEDGPFAVDLTFTFPRPKTVKRAHPIGREGDIDRLARAVLDALTGIVYRDDKQVVNLWALKNYQHSGPGLGVWIEIRSVP